MNITLSFHKMRTLFFTHKDLVEEVINTNIEDIRNDAEKVTILQALYREVKGASACCFDSALLPFHRALCNEYAQVNSNYQKPKKKMANSAFKLKQGRILDYVENGEVLHVTNENMTDRKALLALKENPSRKACFEEMPEDWEKQMNELPEVAPAVEEQVSEETKEVSEEEPVSEEGEKPAKSKKKK